MSWKKKVLIAALFYGALWLLTAIVGTRRVADMVDFEIRVTDNGFFYTDQREYRYPPYYFCWASAYAPFLVMAEYGDDHYRGSSDVGLEVGTIELFGWTPLGVYHLMPVGHSEKKITDKERSKWRNRSTYDSPAQRCYPGVNRIPNDIVIDTKRK